MPRIHSALSQEEHLRVECARFGPARLLADVLEQIASCFIQDLLAQLRDVGCVLQRWPCPLGRKLSQGRKCTHAHGRENIQGRQGPSAVNVLLPPYILQGKSPLNLPPSPTVTQLRW